MSPPQTEYVYIPNLIGGQMLRIPVFSLEADYEEEEDVTIPSPSDLTIDTSALPIPARDASPTPSVDSTVESVEEAE
ncbi:hypothetical protein P171DRAFT_425991 [Karstenula rhodostoma CBS 690.94]|uniref:Uncharacterized protein n=1 Tax=Karstenula rhodostoma CBS 690.94 TaxID=1392251 RepID=A0A9P4UIA2_9PLEO|nr:hypothetical protein P171DRAFT_425991 [Karstenula rhodostoma CBS 690.94]